MGLKNLTNNTTAPVVLEDANSVVRDVSVLGVRSALKKILLDGIALNDNTLKPIEVVVNVTDAPYIKKPVITKIEYPQAITAKDYAGYDVDFSLVWDSVECTKVELSIGQYKLELAPSGSILLNVKSVLELSGLPLDSNGDFIIPILFVGYNEYSGGYRIGDDERVSIRFEKGDTIPVSVAVNRIAEGFLLQLDKCSFDDSKYLTHLLHLGDGDNRLIANWQGLIDKFDASDDALIIKMYEPVTDDVRLNDKVWISKIQSETIIETFILNQDESEYCPPLKGANFAIVPDNGIGYQIFNDFLSDDAVTTNQIYQRYFNGEVVDTKGLNIEFVSGSSLLFENFVHFSSASERVKNFWYKIQLLETHQSRYNLLAGTTIVLPYILTEDGLILTTELGESIIDENGSSAIGGLGTNVSTVIELQKHLDSINAIIGGFDAFENFLFTSESSFGYPKQSYSYSTENPLQFPYNGMVNVASTDANAVAWYNYMISLGEAYDRYNPNYLNNNIPQFIANNTENEDFLLFVDMIGQHFDIIWLYIKKLADVRKENIDTGIGIPAKLVQYLLDSMGWDTQAAFTSNFLWEYALGVSKDGVQKYNITGDAYSLQDANNELWRRILSNLPYLLKHKGTARSVKAIMACYGVPQSLITIMEFGGARENDATHTKYTYEDLTYSLNFTKSGEYIRNAWKSVSGTYPNAVEIRFKTEHSFDQSIVGVSGNWSVGINAESKTFGDVTLYVSNSLGDTLYSSSVGLIKMFDDQYKSLLINRVVDGSNTEFQVFLARPGVDRIALSVSSSILSISEATAWDVDGDMELGRYFTGSIDEFRVWNTALSKDVFDTHVLLPDSVVGNSYTASTSDLWLRYDFEYPKNVSSSATIKNVALSDEYAVSLGDCVSFPDISVYPYQFTPYERTVTAKVPSVGFNYSNKVRLETQELVTDLSHAHRASVKSFDKADVDSSKLGFFLSPSKELNLDVVKSIGSIRIDEYIGSPQNEYLAGYKELDTLRQYYFQRLDRNIYEYIRLVKYIDKSLFDIVPNLVPARAKIASGLLIEPHILERSKIEWKRPSADNFNSGDGNVVVDVVTGLAASADSFDALLDVERNANLNVDISNYNGVLDGSTYAYLDSNIVNYDGSVNASPAIDIFYENYSHDSDVDLGLYNSGVANIDSNTFYLVGNDFDSIDDLGFGLYGTNGFAMVRGYDEIGNYFDDKKLVTVNTVRYLEYTSLAIYENYTDSVVYSNNSKVRINVVPANGSIPSVENQRVGSELIVSIDALDGYLPTHYRYKNNLSEGLQRSYFKGSVQSENTTVDGLPAIEIFSTNPNIIRVFNTPRFTDSPIIDIE